MPLEPLIMNVPFTNTTQDFWPTMLDKSFLRGEPVKQEIKGYNEMVEHLSEVSKSLPSVYPMASGREYYNHEFSMDIHEKYKYQLTWDINKLKEIIIKTKHPVVNLRYKEIMQYIDIDSLTAAHLNPSFNDPEPIIVAQLSITNAVIVLDGNHRVVRGFYNNPSGAIKAYYLDATQHLTGLADPVFSTLFKLNHNVNVMANYMLGHIRKMKYDYRHHNQSLYRV